MSALLASAIEDDIMSFSCPPPWASDKTIAYESMYIRKAYKDIYKMLCSTMYNRVVIGNPGIGKSYFAVYVLYHACKDGKRVLFHHVPSDQTYLFGDGLQVIAGALATYYMSMPNAELLLMDMGTRERPRYPSISEQVIVFSSPHEGNYVDLVKGGAAKVYMPPWSWNEIEYAAGKLSNLSLEIVRDGFDIYGGIPRYVFAERDEIRQGHLSALNSEINACDMEAVTRADFNEQSHKVCHRIVKTKSDGTYDYGSYEFVLASKYISQRVFNKLEEKESHQLKIFLKESGGFPTVAGLRGNLFEPMAHNFPTVAGLRGSLFEPMAHNILARGGKFLIRKLVKGGETDSEPFEEVFLPKERLQLSSLRESELSTEGKYLVPKSKTLISVDAIAPPGAAFQMTVSNTHTIHAGGLKKVIEFCSKECTTFRFYFVVPEDIFMKFTKIQKYVTENKTKATAIPELIKNTTEQYALCISFV